MFLCFLLFTFCFLLFAFCFFPFCFLLFAFCFLLFALHVCFFQFLCSEQKKSEVGGPKPLWLPNREIVSFRSCVRARARRINGGFAEAVHGLGVVPPRFWGRFDFGFLLFGRVRTF